MKKSIFALIVFLFLFACEQEPASQTEQNSSQEALEQSFKESLLRHLQAVSNRDIETLKATLSPDGNMHFIFPGTEMITTAEDFAENQKMFFSDTTWTFESKIVYQNVGNKIGYAIVNAMYKEPERNGKPYFNNMLITYVLERNNGNWFVIHDQPTSIKKSTDN